MMPRVWAWAPGWLMMTFALGEEERTDLRRPSIMQPNTNNSYVAGHVTGIQGRDFGYRYILGTQHTYMLFRAVGPRLREGVSTERRGLNTDPVALQHSFIHLFIMPLGVFVLFFRF